MTVKEFIVNNIDFLLKEFPWMTFRYQYKPESNVHFVEATPLDTHNNNDQYSKRLFKVYNEFSELFPDSFLSFISSDAIIELDDPAFVKSVPVYKSVFESTLLDKQFALFNTYYANTAQQFTFLSSDLNLGHNFEFSNIAFDYKSLYANLINATTKIELVDWTDIFKNFSNVSFSEKITTKEIIENYPLAA